ncbi:hypothetical protein ABY59_0200059 [Enterobacter phage phiEap-2]|uniref:hypothetical protein n=1 Tax=Enterobacter phage phiEap-2 TaxID=1701257 RepID=UPI0006BCB16F|nr:hypothetical protein ABY59_0200059 [Enterobacter phage phiEap-2]ALA45563.1 hypothetical protein ABY59_0200059 [Enterobacter phage phiEap-2]
MLETIIKLLERFVVAHELIAANSVKQPELTVGPLSVETAAELERARGKSTGGVLKAGDEPTTVKAKPEEDDLADDEPEEKPKRKPRATKPKAEPEPDLDKLREEIEVMAKHIGSSDSDDCADELDDLLDEYDARSVKKLKDLQVQEFHKELKAIVAKYYDIEE